MFPLLLSFNFILKAYLFPAFTFDKRKINLTLTQDSREVSSEASYIFLSLGIIIDTFSR